jgi:hypothetical protein
MRKLLPIAAVAGLAAFTALSPMLSQARQSMQDGSMMSSSRNGYGSASASTSHHGSMMSGSRTMNDSRSSTMHGSNGYNGYGDDRSGNMRGSGSSSSSYMRTMHGSMSSSS